MATEFRGGSIQLYYREEGLCYDAKITRAIQNDSTIMVSFEGSDEYGAYSGDLRLFLREGDIVEGAGKFKSANYEPINVRLDLRKDGDTSLTFTGAWFDEDDDDPYQCYIELECDEQ